MNLSFDPGYGNIKLYCSVGSLVMPSAVSVGDERPIRRMAGLRVSRAPLRIQTNVGTFHVGEGAHDWGRPVESLDFDRLAGSPEVLALWYGAMSQLGLTQGSLRLIVGLPIEIMAGDDAADTQRAIRQSLRGDHAWLADGQECAVCVEAVLITSQPVGAMFDYLLDDNGQMLASRRAAFKGEIGILGVGMNTMDLLVVRGGSPVQRFTAGETLGVRRLLDLLDSSGAYSLAERDTMLRAGQLDLGEALTLWQSEVMGFIERQWSRSFRRFAVVVATGGGSLLLKDSLLRRFRSKLHFCDDPVRSTARGLFKYALMRDGRPKHGENS